jgi:glucosamine-6-phosphate deaminase
MTGTRPRVVQPSQPETLVFSDRATMGAAAAGAAAAEIRRLIAEQGAANVVFASAPSQEEFLRGLAQAPDLDWSRVRAFHLDEYVGLDPKAPQAFAQFLRDRLVDHVAPGEFYYIDGKAPDLAAECDRYAQLLQTYPLDLSCIGIGENGHIAFNDPHVADFDDSMLVKPVDLDETSREQQVHDGCFATLDQVPRVALTLTIPAIAAAPRILCMVPGPTKAQAVQATLRGPIDTACPASILRRHANATLFLDEQSASLL